MSRVLLSIGAVQVCIMLVGLVRSKVLSVLLGPAEFGIVSTIDQAVLALVSLGALSLPFTALKFLARSHSEGSEPFRRTFASFFRGLVVLAAVTVGLVLALLVARPGLFGEDIAAYRGAMMIAVLGAPPAMLTILFVNTLAAAQRTSASVMFNLVIASVLVVGAVVGELVGGVVGLYVGTVLAGVAAISMGLLYLRHSLGVRVVDRGAGLVRALKDHPEIVSYSGLLYLAMASYALTMFGARLLVLSDLGAVQAGLFQALMSLALTVGAVMTPMNNLFLAPLVNRRMPTEAKIAAADDFARKISVLLILAALPLVLFPKLVLTVLFSADFAPAAGALFLFVAWQCVYQIVNVYMQLLVGLDDVGFISLVTCLGFGCAAVMFFVLVPPLGLGGAAISLILGMAIIGLVAAVRLHGRFAAGLPVAVLLRSAFCVGAIVLAGVIFPGGSVEWGAGALLSRAGFAVGVTAALWALLAPEERRAVATGLARLTGGRLALDTHPS